MHVAVKCYFDSYPNHKQLTLTFQEVHKPTHFYATLWQHIHCWGMPLWYQLQWPTNSETCKQLDVGSIVQIRNRRRLGNFRVKTQNLVACKILPYKQTQHTNLDIQEIEKYLRLRPYNFIRKAKALIKIKSTNYNPVLSIGRKLQF